MIHPDVKQNSQLCKRSLWWHFLIQCPQKSAATRPIHPPLLVSWHFIDIWVSMQHKHLLILADFAVTLVRRSISLSICVVLCSRWVRLLWNPHNLNKSTWYWSEWNPVTHLLYNGGLTSMRTVCVLLAANSPRQVRESFFISSSVEIPRTESLWVGDGSSRGRVALWLEGAEEVMLVGEWSKVAKGEDKDGLEGDAGRVEDKGVEQDAEAEAEEEAPWCSASPESSLCLGNLSGWSTCAIWSLLFRFFAICEHLEHKWEEHLSI